jgi:hypothetical protein
MAGPDEDAGAMYSREIHRIKTATGQTLVFRAIHASSMPPCFSSKKNHILATSQFHNL